MVGLDLEFERNILLDEFGFAVDLGNDTLVTSGFARRSVEHVEGA